MTKNHSEEVKDILGQQLYLKQVREEVNNLSDKSIFVISGDFNIREEIRGHLITLGFQSKHVKSSNSSAEIVNNLKHNVAGFDLIICHLKHLDSRASSQTGLHLFKIVKEMLLNVGVDETIPFIFIEKSFNKTEIVSALKAGAQQFLVIPADPISLGKKLVEVFKKPEKPTLSREITGLLFEANKLRDQGSYEKAITAYNRVLEITGDNVEIITEKANTLLVMGDIDQAIQLFKRAVEIESNFPRAYQGLGMAYEQLGDITEAKKNYKKVLELEPHNVQICYNVGVLYQKESNFDKAKAYFDKGIEQNKKFIKNYLGLAKNYEIQGNPKESLKVYKQALKLNPNQTFLYIKTGDFCLKHNLFLQAEEVFSSALSINKNHIHLYNRLGIALRKQNKYDEAIANYTKAIKIKPDDANLQYNQAKAYFLKGEENAAIDILNKAFHIDPDLIAQFQKDNPFSRLLEDYPDKFRF